MKLSSEEKYLQDNISLIRAAVLGTVLGLLMFPSDEPLAERSRNATNRAMELIEKDVRKIYKHGKRIGKSLT